MRAATYARISLDRQDGEGVDRQRADCAALAAKHGWEVMEFVDNDLSAYRAMRRPAWHALLQALRNREVQAVVAYHPDRLYRRLTDLEDLIDAVQTAGAEVATVKAGDIDLSTASGRMMARILGSVSRHESERIGERVSRAKAERARQGRPSGGGRRPFGLTASRDALVPDEAAVVREVADRFLAGESSLAICRDLDERGIRNTGGSTWTLAHIRRMVTNPYVAGLREYHGEIVGEAAWPAILDVETWQRCRSLAASRKRGRRPSESRLLVGVLVCSRCGRGLIGNFAGSGVYRCDPQPRTTNRGCGSISISAAKADAHVLGRAGEWLADRRYTDTLIEAIRQGTVDDHELREEITEATRRLGVLASMYASGDLSDSEYRTARSGLHARLSEAEGQIVAKAAPVPFNPAKIATAWETMPAHEKRPVLLAMFGRLPVLPGHDDDGRILSAEERIVLATRPGATGRAGQGQAAPPAPPRRTPRRPTRT